MTGRKMTDSVEIDRKRKREREWKGGSSILSAFSSNRHPTFFKYSSEKASQRLKELFSLSKILRIRPYNYYLIITLIILEVMFVRRLPLSIEKTRWEDQKRFYFWIFSIFFLSFGKAIDNNWIPFYLTMVYNVTPDESINTHTHEIFERLAIIFDYNDLIFFNFFFLLRLAHLMNMMDMMDTMIFFLNGKYTKSNVQMPKTLIHITWLSCRWLYSFNIMKLLISIISAYRMEIHNEIFTQCYHTLNENFKFPQKFQLSQLLCVCALWLFISIVSHYSANKSSKWTR